MNDSMMFLMLAAGSIYSTEGAGLTYTTSKGYKKKITYRH